MKKSFLPLVFLVTMLIVLPGCNWRTWFSGSCSGCDTDEGVCYISLNGTSAITQGVFLKKLDELCQARPDIKQALATLPEDQQQGFYDQFAEALLSEVLIQRFINERNLTSSAEYQETARLAHQALETQLINNLFQKHILEQIERDITNDIAQAYYQENRERIGIFKRAPFIETAGGVQAIGIEGLSRADAEALAVRAEKQDLRKLGEEFKRKVKNYGLVSPRSVDIDERIRTKVLGYTSAPHADVIELSKGRYAVVKVETIVPDTYKPYTDPEVAQAVRSFLIRNELGKAVTQTMDDLKKKYGAVVHRDAIKGSRAQRQREVADNGHNHQKSCSH